MRIQQRHYLFGFIVLIVLILIIYKSYGYFGEPQFARRIQENFTQSNTQEEVKKEIDQTIEETNAVDIITNGSFELGKDIQQLAEKQGGNFIITLSNPGNSSNVLKQTQINPENNKKFKNTYYMLQIKDLLPNRSYYINSYVYQTADWNGKDYLYNVLMQPTALSYNRPELKSGDGKILEQIKLANNTNWNLTQFEFRTPEDFNGIVQIYLGYRPDNTNGFRYLTGVIMRQYLPYAKDYPVSDKLRLFLNGVNCNSYDGIGNTWKDLSDNSNDFIWNVKPKFQSTTGQFIMESYTATGPTGFRLLHPKSQDDEANYQNQFTLIMDPQIQTANSLTATPTVESEQLKFNQQVRLFLDKVQNPKNIRITEDDQMVILFQGNTNIGLAVFWPKNNGGKIKLVIADTLFETANSINPTNNLMYSFMFNGNNFIILEGTSIIFNEACNPIYFKTRPVKINPLQTFNGMLRYVIFYNRPLRMNEIMKIHDYVKANDKATNKDCIEELRPNITDYTLNVPGGSTMDCRGLQTQLDRVKRAVELRLGRRRVSPEEYARIRKEEEDKILTPNDRSCIATQGGTADNLSPYDSALGSNCPRMFHENGQYVIHALPGSEIARIYGRPGRIVLANDETTAQKIYAINHPQCVRQPTTTARKSNAYCPFLIKRDFNPCSCSGCDNVDWSKDPLQQNVSEQCKRSVRNYCDAYADIEGKQGQACYYWGEGKDLPEARRFRNFFGEMSQCDFKKADITKHPDLNKYIRKDLVSSVCANCPLDSYQKPTDPRKNMTDSLRSLVNLPF